LALLTLLKPFDVDIAPSRSSHRFPQILLETGFIANRKTWRGFQQSQSAGKWGCLSRNELLESERQKWSAFDEL